MTPPALTVRSPEAAEKSIAPVARSTSPKLSAARNMSLSVRFARGIVRAATQRDVFAQIEEGGFTPTAGGGSGSANDDDDDQAPPEKVVLVTAQRSGGAVPPPRIPSQEDLMSQSLRAAALRRVENEKA